MKLCADDYALNPSVSKGILNLLEKKKINSVSCLTTTEDWKAKATDLKDFFKTAEIGLHLSLTEPQPIHSKGFSLGKLATQAYFGRLKKQDLVKEIRTQMELFSDKLGVLPHYIDGHEFCHHLPIVRKALIEVAREFEFKKNNVYIRVFHPGNPSLSRNFIFGIFNHISSFPSKKLISLLKKEGFAFNARLLGFHPYSWKPEKYFSYYFEMKPSDKDIFFCHPGLPSEDLSDKLRNYRCEIYNFMMSPQFDQMLEKHNISLSKKTL